MGYFCVGMIIIINLLRSLTNPVCIQYCSWRCYALQGHAHVNTTILVYTINYTLLQYKMDVDYCCAIHTVCNCMYESLGVWETLWTHCNFVTIILEISVLGHKSAVISVYLHTCFGCLY